jgi:LPXTG-motif cell wall-anchored protein
MTTGIYLIDVNLSYTTTRGTQTQISQVGVIVGGGTDFDLSVESSSSNEYTVNIINIGKNDAQATTLTVPDQKNVSAVGTNTAVLGEITKGDFTVANFQLNIQAGAPEQNTNAQKPAMDQNVKNSDKKTEVKFQIYYTDTMGNRQMLEKSVVLPSATSSMTMMNRTSATTNTSSFSWWYVAIIIIVLGAIGIYYYKKRKVVE